MIYCVTSVKIDMMKLQYNSGFQSYSVSLSCHDRGRFWLLCLRSLVFLLPNTTWFSNILTLNVPDEAYSKNASRPLNYNFFALIVIISNSRLFWWIQIKIVMVHRWHLPSSSMIFLIIKKTVNMQSK